MDASPRALTAPPGAAGALALILGGAATLLVELALIRFVPGQIRILGYFTNFVLLAAFLGLGAGMLAFRRWPSRAVIGALAPVGFLIALGAAVAGAQLHIAPSAQDFLFVAYREQTASLPLPLFLPLAFLLLAVCCLPLGWFVGYTLDGPRPLRRYALNVAGSLLGIAIFAVISSTSAPSELWVGLAGASSLVTVLPRSPAWRGLGAAAVVGAVVVASHTSAGTVWSPYQKISAGDLHLHAKTGLVADWRVPLLPPEEQAQVERLAHEVGFIVRVNDDSYQNPVDLSPAAVAERPALRPTQQQYDAAFLPLTELSGREVLVLGAGTGNDVAAALRAGATRVDAVEIDPEILRLGEQHPERPYADTRVHVHTDDARAFLSRTDRRFDLIVFGMLDSHILMSQKSGVRLDAYVFTRESFALCRQALKPGGVLVVSHAVGRPWFVERMRATLTEVFGRPPAMISDLVFHPSGFIYAAGERIKAGPSAAEGTPVLEDDWPFVYLEDRAIPDEYLLAMFLMAACTLLLVRGVGGRSGVDLFFFALGAAFMLLETRAISVLALLVGATWGVNAAVFAGVLTMALVATAWASRRIGRVGSAFPGRWYLLLIGALALNFALPLDTLHALPFAARVALGALLVSLPLFASGVVFAVGLHRAGAAHRALASNLLGALAGGLVEYMTMVTGFRYLLVLAAAFYLLALATDWKARGSAALDVQGGGVG